MRKLILRNHQSPGDLVMLTAAVRDLHKSHPGGFQTDVRTSCMALWDNNPYITSVPDADKTAQIIECHYPLINQCNSGAFHFIHGFIQHLSSTIGAPIKPTEFKGDIHLSQNEKSWISQIHEITGEDTRFWIIVAGGKNDYTIKWWDHDRWQAVVDHFKGRIIFVQVGETHHHHPGLRGVLDLRGKTNLRQLIRLVYHSDGVICPVTSLMHLAAAVEYRRNPKSFRPCVVVAGGREPNQWEAYPGHQFLHTIGMLPCCAKGGCWRSRSVPLSDGDSKDQPSSLCSNLSGKLPRCMDMIQSGDVIRAIEGYLTGGPWLAPNLKLVTKAQRHVTNGAASVHINGKVTLPQNEVEIRVAGMRRSGLHAVINWLAGLYQGKICFVNDVNHASSIKGDLPCSHSASIVPESRVALAQDKSLLLHSYEDCSLATMRRLLLRPDLRGESRKIWEVLILRDPYNMLASRIRLHRSKPKNAFTRDLLLLNDAGKSEIVTVWKKLAREFVALGESRKEGVLIINFNRWHSDATYRVELCQKLGVPPSDRTREAIPLYGFGSSFDGRKFNGSASMMKLHERWHELVDDPLYRELVGGDDELKALSQQIFNDIADEHHRPFALNDILS